MIRPCDKCHGTGQIRWHDGHSANACLSGNNLSNYEHRIEPCSRCVDMPWLPRTDADDWITSTVANAPGWWERDEPFKPDPSTVMRWCTVHKASAGAGEPWCDTFVLLDAALELAEWHRTVCSFDWIETPTPLTTTTIRQTPNKPTKKNH